MPIYLTRVCEWMRPCRCVYTVQLTRDSVTCRLRMPERFPANGNPQSGNADLANVYNYRAVCPLRRVMPRAWRMMGMRLMRVMHVMMRIMQIMMRIVNVVMRTVDAVVGVVNGRVSSMPRDKGRIGQAERVGVSLITISDGWTAACRHMIPR